MSLAVIPVKALVWLHVDENNDVAEAELVADTSWISLDAMRGSFFADGPNGAQRDMAVREAQAILDKLVESDHWRETELTIEV